MGFSTLITISFLALISQRIINLREHNLIMNKLEYLQRLAQRVPIENFPEIDPNQSVPYHKWVKVDLYGVYICYYATPAYHVVLGLPPNPLTSTNQIAFFDINNQMEVPEIPDSYANESITALYRATPTANIIVPLVVIGALAGVMFLLK